MKLFEAVNQLYYDIALSELHMMNQGMVYANITYNSLLYLDIISYTHNCTVSYLADALLVSKPAVTMKVNEFIKQKLVEKVQSKEDKRIYFIKLSPEIAEEFELFNKVLKQALMRVQQKYTPEQLELFCEIIKEFSSCFKEANHKKPLSF